MPERDRAGKWLPGVSGNPEKKLKPGHEHRWAPGQSGNPAGKPKTRARFEAAFYAGLIDEGSAEEAARLLWECARAKEPWAVQTLLSRIAPPESRLRISPEPETNGVHYDPTRLTEAELDLLIELGRRATVTVDGTATRLIDAGESPEKPA